MEETEQIEVIRTSVTLGRLRSLAEGGFGDLVKAVVDIEQGAMAIGGGMHADEEAVLLDQGSRQRDLWGINLYPAEHGSAGWYAAIILPGSLFFRICALVLRRYKFILDSIEIAKVYGDWDFQTVKLD